MLNDPISYHTWHLSNHLPFPSKVAGFMKNRKKYDFAAISENMGTPENTSYECIYEEPNLARLTPDSTYRI